MIWSAVGLLIIFGIGYGIGFLKGTKWQSEQSIAALNNLMNGTTSTSPLQPQETSTRSLLQAAKKAVNGTTICTGL